MVTLDTIQNSRGTFEVPREFLHEVPLPEAGERTRWKGIQHGVLADTIMERVEANGLRPTKEQWTLQAGGNQLYGYVGLDLPPWNHRRELPFQVKTYGDFSPEVVGMRLGVKHGNDSLLALYFMVCLEVLVCSNGMTVERGAFPLKKKHTSGLEDEDLPELVDQGICNFLSLSAQAGNEIETLKSIEINGNADALFMEAGRRRILAWSGIGKAEKEWREPRHPEFKDRSGWSFQNAFTQVARSLSPRLEMDVTTRIRDLVLESGQTR